MYDYGYVSVQRRRPNESQFNIDNARFAFHTLTLSVRSLIADSTSECHISPPTMSFRLPTKLPCSLTGDAKPNACCSTSGVGSEQCGLSCSFPVSPEDEKDKAQEEHE